MRKATVRVVRSFKVAVFALLQLFPLLSLSNKEWSGKGFL